MLTISAIKADVGSIGGHTRPSQAMLQIAQERLQEVRESQVGLRALESAAESRMDPSTGIRRRRHVAHARAGIQRLPQIAG